ncbi:lmo0954 family membrane protein [Kurthia sibirica]|uniref:ABC transporter permease n=1 Tax=Kurthia sibirica TaxID=202750 RepID=A0A2U3APW6_9BACL|nr:ABC transporter permease [Kurthia sibirica]PWI26583.1 ABC transporter permease [Kurthia sibirica]GEK32835.1 hypothetical protein KSI01_03680 [Kurthia sibirica]
MRKALLIILGIIAACIVLGLLGPLVGLAVSAAITYAGLHLYLKATSSVAKFIAIVVGLIGIISAITNIPGLIAIIALAVIYMVYRKWDRKDQSVFNFKRKSNDPFTNFEKQWSEIKK